LRTLTSGLDLSAYYRRVASAAERVLMLDYDGTLAPFHERPECAFPYPGVPPLIEEIVGSGGTRVVIVSGRPAAEVPPLLGLSRRPEIWGAHGWERLLPDGTRRVEDPGEEVRAALARGAAAVDGLREEGARLERKLASVALHWRGLPAERAACVRDAALAAWGPVAETGLLEVLPFAEGLELRAAGFNKEHAVRAVLAETGADSAVAYLGDDWTDEDAFRAVKPHGLAVLVRSELRTTAADLWIEPPHELIEFMARWRTGRT
jgi:trehalose 6-phosphate phosphatase